jgi:hypothetical protein
MIFKVHLLVRNKTVGTVIFRFGHKDVGGPAQIPIVRLTRINKPCRALMPCFSSIATSISALMTGPV